jgi:hypothetical protein
MLREARLCSISRQVLQFVDIPKELTECKEEKEDGDVEQDRDGLGHPSHLKLVQAIEEICPNAATPVGLDTDP